MKFKQKALKDKIVLTLSGELTLPYAAELKTVLLDAVGKGKPVTVAFKAVEDADLSLLQILCSAHRTALSTEKPFTVEGAFPDPVKEIMTVGGLTRHRGCALSKNEHDCLWVGSEA